jgi:hypothetical protein
MTDRGLAHAQPSGGMHRAAGVEHRQETFEIAE